MLDLSVLNAPQREAVVHGGGPLLVLAGAGSGKTRVITYRIARLIEEGVPAAGICALSFTNKAAGEMQGRVAGLVAERDARRLTLCTFHALGLSILKAEKRALGFASGFTIYDGADQLGVVREILRSVHLDDRRFDAKAILHRISRAKNAYLGDSGGDVEDDSCDEYEEITRLVLPRYQEALRAFAAVDFDDLIVETARLLDRDEGARGRWATRFLHVLVDEYQDTNRAQLELLRRLVGHGNVTVVGDDDQSIYAWRGAEAANILAFARHFAGAKVVKLEQNYRSTPTILAAANAVIRNNAVRHDKALWSDRKAGERVRVIVCADADGEAKFVCDELERLRLEERRRYEECSVLYRSNIQARPLEEALAGRRIPFDMRGGQKLSERKEVRDVIAYLKLALHPKDEIALRRIVNYPARGIGPTTLERAAKWAESRRTTLWEALERVGEIAGAGTPAKVAVKAFVEVIVRARATLRAGGGGLVARQLVEDIGLVADLRAASPSMAAAQRRIDNVSALVRSLGEREKRAPGPQALAEYLQFLSLSSKDDDAADGGDQLTLTTLHGAKGLEWPIVFLIGLEEELLPHARTLYPHGPDVEGEADVSEERRLAYVGITRARERLYLSHARMRHKNGADRPRTPSRFLEEIPAELIERHDLAAAAREPVGKDELRKLMQGLLGGS